MNDAKLHGVVVCSRKIEPRFRKTLEQSGGSRLYFLVHDVEMVVPIQLVRPGSPVKHERIQHAILDELKKPRTPTNGYHIFILARMSRVRISVPKVWIHMVLRYSYDSNKMNQDVVDAIR